MFTLRHTLLTTVICFALSACGQQSTQSDNPSSGTTPGQGEITVTIATANPLTGSVASWGKDAADGVKLAVDEANAKNIQWNGQKVLFKYLSEDDQGDPKTAATVASRFVDAKVNVVVGHLTTGPSMVASKVYDQAGIPEIVYSVTGPDFTKQGFKGAFRVIANDAQQGEALGKYAVEKLGVKTFAVVNDKTAYGEGLSNDFAKFAEAAGAKLVATEYTNTQATEFGAIVTALKKASPDLVFYGGMDPQGAPLVREMRRQSLNAKFMGADGLQTDQFISLAAADAEGVFASSAGAPKTEMPGYTQFNEAYKKAYNHDVIAYAPYAYDATNVIINAMNKAQSGEPAKYLPELAKTDYQGVTGKIQFQESGDIKNGIVTLYEVKGGKWEVLK